MSDRSVHYNGFIGGSRALAAGFAVAAVLLFPISVSAQDDIPGTFDPDARPEQPDETDVRLTGTGLDTVDIGANLNHRSEIREQRPSFRSILSAFLRSDPQVRDRGTFNFLFEASLTSIVTQTEEGPWSTRWRPDIDHMRLGGIFPHTPVPGAVFRQRIGRFTVSEPTGLVFSSRVDGIAFDIDMPNIDIRLAAGYTGLIGVHNSNVAMSFPDLVERASADTWFGPPRIVLHTGIGLPEIIGRQSVTVGAVAQFDRRVSDDATPPEELLDSQYAYVKVDGPIAGGLYYDASVAGMLKQLDRPEEDLELGYGLAGRMRARYFLGVNDRHVVTLEARYGSGEVGAFDRYTPISTPSLGLLKSYSGGDLLLGMLDYSVRPFVRSPRRGARSLQLSVYGSPAFRADPTADDGYRGTEAGGRVTARPFSDLGARVWAGGFFPEPASGDDPEFIGRLELSMRY